MKLLKAVVLVLLLAVTGCKESADTAAKDVAYYSLYSGDNTPSSAARE